MLSQALNARARESLNEHFQGTSGIVYGTKYPVLI